MSTTYCSTQDLDSVLEGFVPSYYGSHIDDADDITIGTQYNVDIANSFQQANEWLYGISHIKTVPVGTQSDGNHPFHVRMLQANLMVYNRLLGRHYGEFTDGIPGWVRTYLTRANDILSDIKGQNVVFTDDTTQGESGIGIGSFYGGHTGGARWFTNWETGLYVASDFAKTYVIQIDGTTDGNDIGESTFKWSRDGGSSFAVATALTGTSWQAVEEGLEIRWETNGTGNQLEYGERFDVRCVPMNIPVKSNSIRNVTFLRG